MSAFDNERQKTKLTAGEQEERWLSPKEHNDIETDLRLPIVTADVENEARSSLYELHP